ncbi:MAG: LysE family translocator [Alphaproteobacteria bacterium]|nr:LysE family translocator [Alphaproteobacteria bacterium]
MAQWLTLIVVFSVAVISPGPDFVMAVRNSIIFSRRAGIWTAIGFALGVLVHVTYTIFGISAIIAQSVLLFNLIKWAGALYLIYFGIKALQSKGMGKKAVEDATSGHLRNNNMSDFQALRSGFLTNCLNPKATLFFLAIFSQIISPETPVLWQIIYGLTCAIMVFIWFALVALILNQGPIRNAFLKATKWIDKTCGALLIALGVKVAISQQS